MAPPKTWSDKEDKFLIKNYSTMPIDELCSTLFEMNDFSYNRTPAIVRQRARFLGVSSFENIAKGKNALAESEKRATLRKQMYIQEKGQFMSQKEQDFYYNRRLI